MPLAAAGAEIAPGTLFRARYFIDTNVPDITDVPSVRLRTQDVFLTQANYIQMDSMGASSLSPVPAGVAYDLFFESGRVTTGSNYLTFELINFFSDATTGMIRLNEVIVKELALAAVTAPATPTMTWFFDGDDPEGWTPSSASPLFFEPTTGVANGMLSLTATENTHTFGAWISPAVGLSTDEKLVRVTFAVGSDLPDAMTVPTIRLRANQSNLEQFGAVVIDSTGPDGNSPTIATGVLPYALYLLVPANDGLDLIMSFDMLNFDPGDSPTGEIMLDAVTVEELDVPVFP